MGHLQLDFLAIYLTTSFGVSNFRKIQAIKVIYFGKSSKFDAYLKNAHKNSEKVFSFCHKCIWIVCIEMSLLRREYLSWAVNVLTKSLQTLNITMSDIFQLNYVHIDQ